MTRLLPRPQRALVSALALALAAALVAPEAAPAAKRKLPKGFFGTVLDPQYTVPTTASEAQLSAQMALMAKSGVESVRTQFRWENANPRRGVHDWSLTDRVVRAAAEHRLTLLPIVVNTPKWASSAPKSHFYANHPPSKPALYAKFMTALVKRYGPHGSFFRHNPGVPRVPIRRWQVWNEPMQPFYWQKRPWAPSYTKLLKAAHKAVHRADKHAIVVTAGLSGNAHESSWEDLARIYKAGGRHAFDAVAIHAYSNAEGGKVTGGKAVRPKVSVDHLLQIAYAFRQTMRQHHDRGHKPLYFSEFGWGAALHRIPKRNYNGSETTYKGQVARMDGFYKRIATNGRFPDPFKPHVTHRAGSLGIAQTYWYTWASQFKQQKAQRSFAYSGLVKWSPSDGFTPLPILHAYSKAAHHYEHRR